MLLDAIFDKGEIKLLVPTRFKHLRFAVQVAVPDDEIIEVEPAAGTALTAPGNGTPARSKEQERPSDRLRHIVGGYRPQAADEQDYLDYLDNKNR